MIVIACFISIITGIIIGASGLYVLSKKEKTIVNPKMKLIKTVQGGLAGYSYLYDLYEDENGQRECVCKKTAFGPYKPTYAKATKIYKVDVQHWLKGGSLPN